MKDDAGKQQETPSSRNKLICALNTTNLHKAAGKTVIAEQSHQHKSRGRGLGKHGKTIKCPAQTDRKGVKILQSQKRVHQAFFGTAWASHLCQVKKRAVGRCNCI